MNRKIKYVVLSILTLVCIVWGIILLNQRDEELILIASEDEVLAQSVENEVVQEESGSAPDLANKDMQVPTPETEIMVYVCGYVNSPGVYKFKAGSRINDAVKSAGGFREEACKEYVNLADYMQDGMKIYIPSMEELEGTEKENAGISGGSMTENLQGMVGTGNSTNLVNINTASRDELMGITGIGGTRADAIIEYRNSGGRFISIEDVMKVRGIKEGLFAKIKDQITV